MAVSVGGLSTPGSISAEAVRAQLRGRRRDGWGLLFRTALQLALAFTVLVLAVLIWSVLSTSWSVITSRLWDFLTSPGRTAADQAGVYQALRGTFWIGVCVVFVTFPVGIGAAVYLEEYAKKSRLTRFIDLNIRNLAGVPSVVYGILGFTVFVKLLDGPTGGRSTISGALTIALLVLPIVIITSAEALRAVPDSLREAGFGVGATRWEVVRHHVLPYAAPGIFTGTVLSLARALGEAAPLILVGAVSGRLASQAGMFDLSQLTDRFTAMPILITQWTGTPKEGFQELAAAAIVVLLAIVLLANTVAVLLRNRYEKKRQG
jgi:phosphate transport system permease protein